MDDPHVEQYERERAEAVEIAHKAMLSSYIGPPPKLRGDAERMVTALINAGWTPPGEPATEHAEMMSGGGMHIRNTHSVLERVYPLAEWIEDCQRDGGQVYRRRVIVVEDWTEVPR